MQKALELNYKKNIFVRNLDIFSLENLWLGVYNKTGKLIENNKKISLYLIISEE